jgi:hypothetical protein
MTKRGVPAVHVEDWLWWGTSRRDSVFMPCRWDSGLAGRNCGLTAPNRRAMFSLCGRNILR